MAVHGKIEYVLWLLHASINPTLAMSTACGAIFSVAQTTLVVDSWLHPASNTSTATVWTWVATGTCSRWEAMARTTAANWHGMRTSCTTPSRALITASNTLTATIHTQTWMGAPRCRCRAMPMPTTVAGSIRPCGGTDESPCDAIVPAEYYHLQSCAHATGALQHGHHQRLLHRRISHWPGLQLHGCKWPRVQDAVLG